MLKAPGRRGRRRPLLAAVLVPALLAAAAAAPARAATVATTGDTIVYWAGQGERNDVLFTDHGSGPVEFGDGGATITPGRGCRTTGAGLVACGREDQTIQRVSVFVRDGADSVYGESYVELVRIYGGSGDDRLRSGSPVGNDSLLDGGTGRDRLFTALNLGGIQTLRGGPDDDELEAYEGGDYRLEGGRGDDLLRVERPSYSSLVRSADGGSGNDTYAFGVEFGEPVPLESIVAGAGVDTVLQTGGDLALDLLACALCVERVLGSPWGDALLGDGARNILIGAEGDDVIDPRGGPDDVDAGPGADLVLARDGVADTVTCGSGTDRVVADAVDRVDASCETVQT